MSAPSRFIKPGEPVGLRLTAAERMLLVEDMPALDEVLVQRIKEAPSDKIKVAFTLEELKAMAGHIVTAAGGRNEKPKQKCLNAIDRKVQHLLNTCSDDEAQAWNYARAMMTQAGITPEALNPINMLMGGLAALGMDANVVAGSKLAGGPVEAAAAELVSEAAALHDMLRKRLAAGEKAQSAGSPTPGPDPN